MHQLNYILVLSITLLVVPGCNSIVPRDEHNKALSAKDSMQTIVKNQAKALDSLMYGAKRLFDKAEIQFAAKMFLEAKGSLSLLLEKHPSSPESVEGRSLLAEVERELLAIQKKQEAEAKAKLAAEERRLAQATSKMNKRYDDMRGITWYEDKSSGGFRSKIYIYIGLPDDSKPYLRMYNRYYADDGLFIESYHFKIDGKDYYIHEKEYGEIKTNNRGGSIWETLDRVVDKDVFEIMQAVASSKNAKIRYRGKDYYSDRIITSKEKKAIQNVFDAFEALGGELI